MDKETVMEFMSDRIYLIEGKHYKLDSKYKKTRFFIRVSFTCIVILVSVGTIWLFSGTNNRIDRVILLGVVTGVMVAKYKYYSYAERFIPENFMDDLVEIQISDSNKKKDQ